MQWTFARNDGGQESGFHNAGVETFKGNFDRYLARELIQNSLDARLDPNKPVVVKFELLTLKRDDIPDIDRLKVTFARCVEYWSSDKKAKEFFQCAEELSRANTIVALKIGDFNTTGVLGSDTDRSRNWYSLIRCAGSSSKGAGEGGSFGIGKNAPFAASLMRTVFYSTYNDEREHIFQGVATLVSHELPGGSIAQPTGFLGANGGVSVRSKGEIPTKFLRKERGTDIVILGFPAGETWQKDLVYSVLDNFWPAIHFGDLKAIVGDVTIEKENLYQQLEAFSGEEGFTAHLYYRAFTSATHEFHPALPKLRDVSLYLCTGDVDLPKRIAMVRKTGMKIFEKPFRSPIPFCGVFICRNDEGNKLLREMEPPRHDVWDPDHPQKGANRKIEAEYIGFIRDCIHKLAFADDSKIINIPGLSKFLPDDDESPEESFDGSPEAETKAETLDRRLLPENIPGQRIDPRRRPMQPDHAKPLDGEDETASGEGEGVGVGGNGKPNETEGGTGASNGDGKTGSAGGSSGGVHAKPSIPIRYRTYSRNAAAGVYAVAVAPEKPVSADVNLVISTVGDDQKVPADIRSARLDSGQDVRVNPGGILGPLTLLKSGQLNLEVVLREPLRVAMEVLAHEA